MKQLSTLSLLLLFCPIFLFAQNSLADRTDALAKDVEQKVINWRRDFHEHPELSNREFKTAEKIAAHLTSLGLEVQTGIAHTGVVAILTGGKPGPVIGLRADIDALPVVERVDVPFASKVRSTYNGQDVGVMHACGHDTHIAIMMGVAEVLSKVKKDLHGTIKFIFQPAEEGAPQGEEGGAKLMVKEGVLKNPDVDLIFGLHINSTQEVGTINYTPKGAMASSDVLRITVKGKQTHGSRPWAGADPITASAYIVSGLQTVVSRKSELTKSPAVVTIGAIHGGVRNNIIPEEVKMVGTIRTLDTEVQKRVHEEIRNTVTNIAESMNTTAEVEIGIGYPVTYNDPALTESSLPALKAAAGEENVRLVEARTGAEDFSFFAKEVPGFYFFLGGRPKDIAKADAAPHHTPDFYIDESGFELGVRTFCRLVIDHMQQ
ncbi:MAG: amidohydrolase [Bacteroidota bacterium]